MTEYQRGLEDAARIVAAQAQRLRGLQSFAESKSKQLGLVNRYGVEVVSEAASCIRRHAQAQPMEPIL